MRILFLSLFLFGFLTSEAQSKFGLALGAYRNVNCVLWFGQSNAKGYGNPSPSSTVYPTSKGQYIYDYVTTNTWQPIHQNVNDCLDYGSVQAGYGGAQAKFMQLVSDYYNQDQYLLLLARSGTQLGAGGGVDWSETSSGEVFSWALTNYTAAIPKTPCGNIRIKAIVWLQGENDCVGGLASAYLTNFTNFFNAIKTQYNLPNLKCISVGMGDGQTGLDATSKAIVNTAKQNTLGGSNFFVSSDGLATHDGIHFTPESYDILAQRIYQQYIQLD